MTRLLVSTICATVMYIAAYGQGGRIVCDESCREEYLKTGSCIVAEYMPVLIAMTKGLGDADFRRTLASTHAWAPYCWLNGPVARQLGIDCGQGQINEAANVVIGRFMNLALMNLCGYYVKLDRMGTFGYPMPWCLAEVMRRCGWSFRRIGIC